MDIAMFLVGTCAICAVLSMVRAMMNRKEERLTGKKVPGACAESSVLPPPVGRRVRWIDAEEFSEMMRSDAGLIVFHLLDGDPEDDRSKWTRSELLITLPELERAMPWIPPGARIALYRPAGIDFSLAQRLSAITRRHEAFLLFGTLPHPADRLDEKVGEVCN